MRVRAEDTQEGIQCESDDKKVCAKGNKERQTHKQQALVMLARLTGAKKRAVIDQENETSNRRPNRSVVHPHSNSYDTLTHA